MKNKEMGINFVLDNPQDYLEKLGKMLHHYQDVVVVKSEKEKGNSLFSKCPICKSVITNITNANYCGYCGKKIKIEKGEN